MTEHATWLPILGFEGAYEMNADASAVRSVPRRVHFGNSSRMLPSVRMKPDSCGRYHLRKPSNAQTTILYPHQLTPVKEDQS